MCGSAPVSKASFPNRHQIRNAIRKVARTMRKDRVSMDSYDFTYHCMVEGDWTTLPADSYLKAEEAVTKAVMNSTFFNHGSGVCGGTKLTLRKTAKL